MATVERIFQFMKENNLTAKEFAKRAGISQGNITDWKTGRAKPSTEALIKIANTYNISIDYLLGLTSYRNPKEDLEAKLYKLDLSEDEFNEMISLLIDDESNNIEYILKDKSKLSEACRQCLELIYDYEDNGIVTIDENINKLINIITSLDKSKIIHSYNKSTLSNSKGKLLLKENFLVKFRNGQTAIFDGKNFLQINNETFTSNIISNIFDYNDDLTNMTSKSLDIIKVCKPIYETVYKRKEPQKISKTDAEKELSKIYNKEVKITD